MEKITDEKIILDRMINRREHLALAMEEHRIDKIMDDRYNACMEELYPGTRNWNDKEMLAAYDLAIEKARKAFEHE